MAKKLQRRYVVGKEYYVEGGSKSQRRLKFVNRLKIGRQEYLVFLPVRKARKFHKPKKAKGRTLRRAA